MSRRARDERGSSLVEVTVAGALAVLLGLGVLQFFDSSMQRSVEIEQQSQQQAAVRVGVDELVRDLRQAWTGDPALSPVAAVGATTITFYTPDRSTPVGLRRVAYRVAGGRLERSITRSANTGGPPWTFGTPGPWAPVVEAVAPGTVFVARDDAGAVTTDAGQVARVEVTFAVPGVATDHTYRTSVDLRNAST